MAISYYSPGVSAAHDTFGVVNHMCCICLTYFVTMKVQELPVFAPNDYFWENHWKKGEEE